MVELKSFSLIPFYLWTTAFVFLLMLSFYDFFVFSSSG